MIDAYLDRSMIEILEQRAEAQSRTSLPAKEAAVLDLLQRRMEEPSDGKRRRVRRAAVRSRRREPTEASS